MDASTLVVRCRERAGLSQRELADRSGTSASAICLIERGERIPRADTLARIVTATGAELELRITWPPAPFDPAANGRALEQVLDLADHLPHQPGPVLAYPVLRDHACEGANNGVTTRRPRGLTAP